MISFILCLALLIIGYFTYGKVVDNTFGPDDRETPAVSINDGVDYVVMPQWKLFLVQLLNIAGLGPIFGAMQGALWGPIVFLWITFGTIFAGGVHDYFSGMISERNSGSSVAEFTGKYLGGVMQNIMRVFSVVLLIMVGTVFAVGPAGLIVTLCKNGGLSGILTTTLFWLILILVYYFIATFISIDKIIGKIYPVFGLCLIIMAVGAISASLGDREIIAEDLGYMTDSVKRLVEESGYPNMKVIEFAFDERDTGNASDYLPHNYPRNCVVYTGTHDNETLLSWLEDITPAERRQVRKYLNNFKDSGKELCNDLICLVMQSVANLCIVPMQDYLGLDNSARMNQPSTLGKNWKWRLKEGQFTAELQKEMLELATRYGRR